VLKYSELADFSDYARKRCLTTAKATLLRGDILAVKANGEAKSAQKYGEKQ
jgi:hypothetical protein